MSDEEIEEIRPIDLSLRFSKMRRSQRPTTVQATKASTSAAKGRRGIVSKRKLSDISNASRSNSNLLVKSSVTKLLPRAKKIKSTEVKNQPISKQTKRSSLPLSIGKAETISTNDSHLPALDTLTSGPETRSKRVSISPKTKNSPKSKKLKLESKKIQNILKKRTSLSLPENQNTGLPQNGDVKVMDSNLNKRASLTNGEESWLRSTTAAKGKMRSKAGSQDTSKVDKIGLQAGTRTRRNSTLMARPSAPLKTKVRPNGKDTKALSSVDSSMVLKKNDSQKTNQENIAPGKPQSFNKSERQLEKAKPNRPVRRSKRESTIRSTKASESSAMVIHGPKLDADMSSVQGFIQIAKNLIFSRN